jgi:2,3-bisphosphoglycerate-dependent phosphoglycerate mutase
MKKSEKKLKIYLFRHGQTTYNRDHRFTGFNDAKLTTQGKQHAKLIAKKLKPKKFQVAIHTRLSRSKDTLNPVLKFHPECKIILEDDRMIERSYGNLSGKRHSTIIKKYGQKQYDSWHRGYQEKTRPPKGECFKDVEKRVKSFITDLKKFMKKNQINVAISAHGNSIRLFRKIIEKATIQQTVKWFIPYDKVFQYTI